MMETWMSFQLACDMSAVLVCREGYLRSRYRRNLTKTFKWKSRCFVLLENSTLLLYESEESEQPTLSLRINDEVEIETVDDHPTHLKIRYSGTRRSFIGSDVPKLVGANGQEEVSWRIRFPSPNVAVQWKEAMDVLKQTTIEENLAIHETAQQETVAQATSDQTRPSTITGHWRWIFITLFISCVIFVSVGIDRTRLSLSMRLVIGRWVWILILIFCAILLQVGIDQARLYTSRLSAGQRLIALLVFSGCLSLCWRWIFIALTCGILLYVVMKEQNYNRPVQTNKAFTSAAERLKVAIPNMKELIDTLRPPMQRPEPEPTYLRMILTFHQACFLETGIFPPESFVHEHFVLCLLAFMIFSISVLSVASHVVRWRLMLASALFGTAVLLGHDTYNNHFKHPLRYGLYWNCYAQGGAALVCMVMAAVQVRRASGWRPQVVVSNRRKVASALAAGLASLALPLSLRSISESDQPTSKKFILSAVLAFFSGMHFFGWARRGMIIAGFPVGETIYQISLLPAKTAKGILRTAEDCCHLLLSGLWFLAIDVQEFIWTLCRKAFRKAEVLCRQGWDKVLRPFSAAVLRVLSTVNGYLHSFTLALFRIIVDAIKSIWQRFLHIISEVAQALQWVLESAITIASRLLQAFRQVVDFICRKAISFARWIKAVVWGIWLRCARIFRYIQAQLRSALGVMLDRARLFFYRVQELVYRTWSSLKANVVDPAVDFICRKAISFARWIKAVIWGIWLRCARIFRYIQAQLRSALGVMLDRARLCFYRVQELVYRTWSSLKANVVDPLLHISSRALTAFARLLMKAWKLVVTVVWRVFSALEKAAVQIWVVVTPLLDQVLSWCVFLYGTVAAVLSRFFKKHWQLISAGFAFNGSYRYVCAAIADGSVSDRGKYLLGAWSLALIGYILANSVLTSRETLASQRVVVDQSALKFMDLYICYALARVLSSGWHAVSKTLELSLNMADFVVRKTCSFVWWLLGLSFRSILEPLLSFAMLILRRMWNSPYVSMFASAGTVCIAYIIHAKQITLDVPAPALYTSSLLSAAKVASRAFVCVSERLSIVVRLTYRSLTLLRNVYEPVMNADASPDVALSCWLFASAVAKSRSRVRIKTFAVPVVAFYMAGVAASSLFKAVSVSLLIWFCLSLLVDKYEDQSRERAGTAFQILQQKQSAARRSNAGGHKQHAEISTCVICLDDIDSDAKDRVWLPCAHQFHDQCIHRWLETSCVQRCPICRRATGGWDRFLEVAF